MWLSLSLSASVRLSYYLSTSVSSRLGSCTTVLISARLASNGGPPQRMVNITVFFCIVSRSGYCFVVCVFIDAWPCGGNMYASVATTFPWQPMDSAAGACLLLCRSVLCGFSSLQRVYRHALKMSSMSVCLYVRIKWLSDVCGKLWVYIHLLVCLYIRG